MVFQRNRTVLGTTSQQMLLTLPSLTRAVARSVSLCRVFDRLSDAFYGLSLGEPTALYRLPLLLNRGVFARSRTAR